MSDLSGVSFGFGVRLIDYISSGCIPVILDPGRQLRMPLELSLDYSAFSVRVAFQDIPTLPDIIGKFSAFLLEQLGKEAREAQQRGAGGAKAEPPPAAAAEPPLPKPKDKKLSLDEQVALEYAQRLAKAKEARAAEKPAPPDKAAAARRKAEARKKATEEEQNLTEEEVFRQQQKDDWNKSVLAWWFRIRRWT